MTVEPALGQVQVTLMATRALVVVVKVHVAKEIHSLLVTSPQHRTHSPSHLEGPPLGLHNIKKQRLLESINETCQGSACLV